MRIKSFTVAGAGTLLAAGAASGGLIGVDVRFSPEQHPDPDVATYRVYLVFDNELDQLLAVSGDETVAPLVFHAGTDLVQNCVLTDSILCDTAGPLDLGGDSWVNIGTEEGDTAFSPNFLDGDGTESVIEGNFFSQSDNGGYFDRNPGTPVLPDEEGSVLIAQFSGPAASGQGAIYMGTANYVPGAADGFVSEAFSVILPFPAPAPGALGAFALLAACSRRRRR